MDFSKIKQASFILDESQLIRNLKLMKHVQEEADVEIILALKGFAMWKVFPLVKKYLAGATASSLNEARLVYEEMSCKAHTYCVGYSPEEFEEIQKYSSHLTFNSVNQFKRFYKKVKHSKSTISCGIRVNPEYSPVKILLYNPAVPGSRLGETIDNIPKKLPKGIEGFHFHTLCESTSYDLEKVLFEFEKRFGHFFKKLKWVNFGGGHLITHKDYDVDHLIKILKAFRKKYPHLKVILEPGSAVAWQTGVLVGNVLDIHESGGVKTLITDISFTAHMPDTIEMPYHPEIRGASDPIEGKPTYRIGGISCLSGDFMMEYSFDKKIKIGDQLIFEDMLHYTVVKTTMFNGIQHPDLCLWTKKKKMKLLKRFGYEDYKDRMC